MSIGMSMHCGAVLKVDVEDELDGGVLVEDELDVSWRVVVTGGSVVAGVTASFILCTKTGETFLASMYSLSEAENCVKRHEW
mmetsp:Transcript_76821/g.223032  ORF Transcript_76821/g.223032 Transcript_76821/m.223032 type:complete len:82 (+) Transcript_76821:112-357(+)